jgi:hypothetical protein
VKDSRQRLISALEEIALAIGELAQISYNDIACFNNCDNNFDVIDVIDCELAKPIDGHTGHTMCSTSPFFFGSVSAIQTERE